MSRPPRVVWPPQRREPARAAIERLMLERGLQRRFEDEVEREARAARDRAARAPGGDSARRDLRELATFTIDPITARDFDDAISARALDGGGARVWVHIADVAAFVPPGSLTDEEARRRATSVYVPGAVEPMLPKALSNDACSLVPGRDRLAVTVELECRGAQVRALDFYRSLIRSDERLDYDRVDRIFDGRERALEPWAAPLRAAREAAAELGRERERRAGSLTLETPEPEFVFDAQGHVSEIAGRVQTESHRLIEHLMIAANEAVAQLLAARQVPCLYRVHGRPEAERVRRLAVQLASLGVPTPPLPDLISPSQAAELAGDLSARVDRHVRSAAARAAAGDRSVARSGGRLALTSLVLRSLRPAFYSPRNIGHAGLGSSCYCHFTSPIRRYPDLVCHRALLHAIAGERAPRGEELEELGEWTSAQEREAMAIERDADDVARCFALEQHLYEEGWEQVFEGEVTGLISAGAFIAFGGLEMPLYEGMLPVRRLRAPDGRNDWWELGEEATLLRAERSGAVLRLGDPVAVRVGGVDPARGRVDLVPAA